jgi:hypothetical protein
MAEKLRHWLRGMPQAQRDLVVILALSVPVYVFLVWLDAFDLFFKYSRSHEDYQLDELVALVFFALPPSSSRRAASTTSAKR